MDDLRLSFDRLREAVIGLKKYTFTWLDEPLRKLNAIRNRLAHRLDTELDRSDLDALARFATMLHKDRSEADLRADPALCAEHAALFILMALAVLQAGFRFEEDLDRRERALHEESDRLFREFFPDDGTTQGPGA